MAQLIAFKQRHRRQFVQNVLAHFKGCIMSDTAVPFSQTAQTQTLLLHLSHKKACMRAEPFRKQKTDSKFPIRTRKQPGVPQMRFSKNKCQTLNSFSSNKSVGFSKGWKMRVQAWGGGERPNFIPAYMPPPPSFSPPPSSSARFKSGSKGGECGKRKCVPRGGGTLKSPSSLPLHVFLFQAISYFGWVRECGRRRRHTAYTEKEGKGKHDFSYKTEASPPSSLAYTHTSSHFEMKTRHGSRKYTPPPPSSRPCPAVKIHHAVQQQAFFLFLYILPPLRPSPGPYWC